MTRPADTALFSGRTCETCDHEIKRGDRVVPKGSTWVHRTCWERAHE